MEKRKYLVRLDNGNRAVVMAEGEDAAALALIPHQEMLAPGDPEFLLNDEVEEVTGPVYRVVTEYKLHHEFVLAAANPEEAKQKTFGYILEIPWQGATILSVVEERVLGA